MVGPRSGIGSLDGFKNTIKRLPDKSRPPQKYRGSALSESSGIAGSSITQGGGGLYTASAVHFDGANTSLFTASLSGTDGDAISAAWWFKTVIDNKNVWASNVAGDYGNYCDFREGDGGVNPFFYGPMTFLSDTGVLEQSQFPVNNSVDDTWHSLIMSEITNVDNQSCKIYIDDVDVTAASRTISSAFITNIAGMSFYLGDDTFGSGAVMDLADFRFMLNTSLLIDGDIPVATRRLFIDENGKPVDPATATGTLGTPTILFSGDSSSFTTNQGTGGTFTLTGTLTDATTSPSD